HDAVVEGERRRLPVLHDASAVHVDERRVGLDVHAAQDRREQERLVLAVAVAAREDGGRLGGLVGARPDLHAGVTYVVLDEPGGSAAPEGERSGWQRETRQEA